MSGNRRKNMTHLAVLFTVCGALLLIAASGSLIVRCRALELRLDEVFMESLTAHTRMRGEGARQLIDDTESLVEDAGRLLEEDSRPLEKEWANPILGAMNLGGRRIGVSLLSLEDMAGARPGSEDEG